MTAAHRNAMAMFMMSLHDLTLEEAQAWLQPGDALEKNWMPCVDGDRLRLVYSTDPLIVFDWAPDLGRVMQDPAGRNVGGTVRGGSQLIKYRDGWLAVVHRLHFVDNRKVYAHQFAAFDRDLTSVRFGRTFFFNRVGIEFCAGLAHHQGRFILSYGVEDSEAWIAEVAPETVAAFLDGADVAGHAQPSVLSAAPTPQPLRHAAPSRAVQEHSTEWRSQWGNVLLGGCP